MCLAVSQSPHPARVKRVTRAAWERRALVGNIVNDRNARDVIRIGVLLIVEQMSFYSEYGTFELSTLNPIRPDCSS